MTNTRLFTKWLAALVLVLVSSTAFAGLTIDTNPTWDGTQFINSFGVTDTATYGQIIVPPIGQTGLAGFSFQIGFATAAIQFQPEVYAWDAVNRHAVGAALWEGAPVTLPAGNGYTRFTFTIPGGVSVTPGTPYVIFVSTSRLQTGAPASASRFGAVANSAYPDGQFVFLNNNTNPGLWTTGSWSTIALDLAFSVVFTGTGTGSLDVPALSGPMLLLLTAALAIAGALALRFRS
jgi:hypothetical protein